MELRSWSLILLLGFLWGSSFLFVELLLEALTPFSIVYLRVLIASLIFLVFLIIIRPRFQLTKGVILSLFVMAILNNILPFLLIAIGQQSTTGSLASILNANTSLLTILLASILIPSEKLSINRLVGVVVGVLGVIIAVGFESLFDFYDGRSGKYLILAATVSYAFAGIWGRIKLSQVPPIISASGMLIMSTVVMTPFAFFYRSEEIMGLSLNIFVLATAFALLCSVAAYFIYFKILEGTGAGNLLLCTIIIPPSAIILNAIFLGEAISFTELFGLLLIVFGLLILDGRILQVILGRRLK